MLVTTTFDVVSLLHIVNTCAFTMIMLPSVYQKLGFIEVVGRAMEQSMAAAVDEVKALPEYTANMGEVLCDICVSVACSVLPTCM